MAQKIIIDERHSKLYETAADVQQLSNQILNKHTQTMDSSTYGNYYPSERPPSRAVTSPSLHGRTFNKYLDPRHLDIADDDKSIHSAIVRKVATIVSKIFRPRQVIILLRLLKALTFCTLTLSMIAELMFIFFVQVSVGNDVNIKLGGMRDMICRLYGVGIAILAIMIELDMTIANTHFAGLKPFLPRSLLLLFVCTLSAASPMISYESKLWRQYHRYNDDDLGVAYGNSLIKDEVPGSAVAFQAMTSFILFVCACVYFVLGLLCLDRFTAPAFLADDDQVAAAVIATAIHDTSIEGNHRSRINDSFDSSYDLSERDNTNIQQHHHQNHGTYNPRRFELDDDDGYGM